MSFGFGMKFQNLLLAKAGYSNIVSADGTLAPFVTFTRSTTGSRYNSAGLLESVAINGPRFDYDPATVTSSNLLRYSQEFDNAAWPKTDATVIANAIDAPDGTFTADKLETTTASNPNIQQTLSSVSRTATNMKFSYYVRAGNTSESYAQIFNNGGDGNYAHTATILSGPGSVSGVGTTAITITGLSQTQWTRVQLGVSSNTNTIGTPTFYIKNRVSGSVIGDFTYIWGAQVELGGSSTGYIATTASPAGNATLLGLLIEEQRTNLLTYSEDFTNAAWPTPNFVVTANAIIAPDGTLTADQITATATPAATSRIFTATSTSHAFTIYVKAGTVATSLNTILLRNNTTATPLSQIAFDGVTGSLGTVSVTSVGNGWLRISVSATTGITIGDSLGLYFGATGAIPNGQYWYVWGGQLEAAAFATSYIPTAAGSVTRTQDDALISSISSIGFNQTEGTVVVENISPFGGTTAASAFSFVGAGANGFNIGGGGTSRWWNGTSNVITANSVASGTRKEAFSFVAAGGRALCLNGGTVATDSGVPWQTPSPTGARIGAANGTAGNQLINGTIKSLRYFPRKLSNAELQQMTA